MENLTLPDWPYAYGGPSGQAILRATPADFIVQEQLGFTPSGCGEHVLLTIQKTAENTEYIARELARFAGVRQRDVSYAGLKDRHAITTQWFSVWLPGKPEPDWQQLTSPNLQILTTIRHSKKLKRGALSANHFQLCLRDWQGDRATTEEQLTCMQQHGIPNYFGEQRFGRHGHNVNKALAMFAGQKVKREQRSIYLSAARSFLFNHILGLRVAQGNWCHGLVGDIFMLAGSHSYFRCDALDTQLLQRLQEQDVHPSGTLWGLGDRDLFGEPLELENSIIQGLPALAQGLEQEKLEVDRRALRVSVSNLTWEFTDTQTLMLSFSLPAGSYATAVIREIITPRSTPA